MKRSAMTSEEYQAFHAALMADRAAYATLTQEQRAARTASITRECEVREARANRAPIAQRIAERLAFQAQFPRRFVERQF